MTVFKKKKKKKKEKERKQTNKKNSFSFSVLETLKPQRPISHVQTSLMDAVQASPPCAATKEVQDVDWYT